LPTSLPLRAWGPRVAIAGPEMWCGARIVKACAILCQRRCFRQTAQCIERAAYRICEELRLDIVTLNAIGNAVVGLIEIELANGQQLVASEDEPRMSADRDSRARTHLANERTFLAWLRTGLSLMAVGLAVAGFLPIDLVPGFPYVRSFSMLLVLSGTVMVVYGANRYERAFKQIETGTYEPARTAVVTIAAIIGFLGILTIPLVLLLR
jgi:putative membrane protein